MSDLAKRAYSKAPRTAVPVVTAEGTKANLPVSTSTIDPTQAIPSPHPA